MNFLDLQLPIVNKLDIDIYRKSIQTDTIMSNDCFHPNMHKLARSRCYCNTVKTIVKDKK